MKTKLYLICLLLASCQSNEIELNNIIQQKRTSDSELAKGNIFPLSKEYKDNSPTTRNGTTFEADWENHSSVTLASGNVVNLPWSSVTDGNIPVNIAFDIKKEDGWEMIFHSFKASEGAQNNRNYMIFHNLRTGILKTFYYLENNNYSNNTGTWNIDFTPSRYWLNHTGEVSVPTALGKVNYWASTNLISLENKGFQMGWNCFQVQLAYDPEDNTNQIFTINSNILNTTNVNLFGEEQSYSNGAILSHGSSNPLSSLSQNITSFVGKEAEKWINDKVNKDSKENAPTSKGIIGIVGGALIKAGVNKIFNHFTASASKITTTTSDLQFTTKGTSKVTGTFTFNGTSPILGLRIPFNKDKVGELGNWNITETPIIYMDPLGDIFGTIDLSSYNGDKAFRFRYRGISKYGYNLIINPKLENHIIKKWVDCDVINYGNKSNKTPTNPFSNFDYGELGRTYSMMYDGRYKYIFDYKDGDYIRIDSLRPSLTAYNFYYGPLSPILLPKADTYEDFYFDATKIFLRMTINMITEFEGIRDTTISTHTYIPRIEWDPKLYDLYQGSKYDYKATQGTY